MDMIDDNRAEKIKHLELIETIIERMARNSFLLKGWAVTLIVGILALAGRRENPQFFLIALLPIVMFWGLDSYYLYQERLYRGLYDWVRENEAPNLNFSMKIPSEIKEEYKAVVFSKTEGTFYLSLVVCVILIYFAVGGATSILALINEVGCKLRFLVLR